MVHQRLGSEALNSFDFDSKPKQKKSSRIKHEEIGLIFEN